VKPSDEIIAVIDEYLNEYGKFLPFKGKYLLKARAFVVANADLINQYLTQFATLPDVAKIARLHQVADVIVDSIGLPPYLFWLKPMVRSLVDSMIDRLVAKLN
jgi:hypothetical protein